MRICCSRYSEYDEQVIAKATSLGLPLIGGTALEYIAKSTNTPGVRTRSDNDLDFICTSMSKYITFKDWVKENIPADKVQVDVMFIRSHDFRKYIQEINGALVMKPEYLIWSKLGRKSKKDLTDIKWLLSIKSLTDEDIVSCVEDLGITEDESQLLTKLAS